MRRIGWVCLLAATAWGGVFLTDDPPLATAPKKGDITGTLLPAGEVQSVQAVSRITGKTYTPAKFDAKAGTFAFTNLPGGETYDLVLDCRNGRKLEGIDLRFVEDRLLRLAEQRRKQLGLPETKPKPFTQQDVTAILQFARDWEDFLDYRRVLYIHGQGDRATVLVELMRTTEFHASQGHLVWRIELWYMQRAGGGWERLPNTERVLRRFRGPLADWQKLHVEYRPELSIPIDAEGNSAPVRFTIPREPDLSTGRLPRTKIRQDTQPHVLGPQSPTSQPTSLPASGPSAPLLP